jgi:hypothetical protein
MGKLLAVVEALRAWIAPIACLVACALLVHQCNSRGDVEAALRKERAEAAARAAQQIVPDDASLAQIAKKLAPLLAEHPAFKKAVADAVKALPGAKPVAVIQGATAAVSAGGPTRPETAACTPVTPQVPSAPPGEILLRRGDQLHLRLLGTELRTKDGARDLALTVGAYRVDPSGDALLAEAPLVASLTDVAVVAAERAATSHWAFGGLGGVLSGNWAAGGILETPTVRIPLVGGGAALAVVGIAGPAGYVLVGGPLFR